MIEESGTQSYIFNSKLVSQGNINNLGNVRFLLMICDPYFLYRTAI